MLRNKKYLSLFLIILLLPNLANSDPSTNNIDHWFDEHDFQIPYESHRSYVLKKNNLKIDNSATQRFSAKQDWSEGIHTFDKSAGARFELPHIQDNSHLDDTKTSNELVGDIILQTPLEYKIIKGDFTSGLSLTPSILLPDEGPGYGSINVGISVKY
jgi:hypothetical protein